MNEISIGGFKKFVKSANRIIDKISVTSGGAVGFSSSFASEHNLSNYTSVILYWNDVTKEIGIQFAATENEESLKMIKNKYGDGRTVNARAFFAMNHIDTKVKYKGRYSYKVVPFSQLDAGDVSSNSMYIIKLTDSVSVNPDTAPAHTPSPVDPTSIATATPTIDPQQTPPTNIVT